MSLFKEIKNAGLDIFIQYHPKVIALKREARKLHKQEKKKSLMQYQEQVAKENGFNNWHHLITLIKKNYNREELEIYEKYKYFLTTKTIEEKYKNGVCLDHYLNVNECVLCLGYDVNFNNYKWQPLAILRSHQLILTPNYEEYSLFLIKQIIAQQDRVITINPNKNTVNELIKEAKLHHREKDIKIINFSSDVFDEQYTTFIHSEWQIEPENFTSIIYNSIVENIPKDNNWLKGHLTSFISSIVFFAHYNSKKNNEQMTIPYLKYFLENDKISEICNYSCEDSENTSFNEQCKAHIKYLIDIQKKEFEKVYEVIKKIFYEGLAIFEYKNIYQNNGLTWDDLLNKDQHIVIFYFGDMVEEKKKEQSNLIISLIANHVKEILMGFKPINPYMKKGKYIFALNTYFGLDMTIIPAQARSACLSFNASFPSLEVMEEKFGSKENAKVFYANSLTKILSFAEKEKFDGETEISTATKHDVLWAIKGTDECQIEFKNINLT